MSSHVVKISIAEVNHYLSLAKVIKGSDQFYDIHVHPFEIVFTKGNYQENQHERGIFSTGLKPYAPPQISEIVLDQQVDKADVQGMSVRPAIFRMKFSTLYAHTGPQVFNKQMSLSAIDRILLLPVASSQSSVNPQMYDMKRIFAEDERFYRAWSVSNDVKNSDIYDDACKAINLFNICAVKQNLTQTEINIDHPDGKKRMNSILDSCTKLNLPLILHSGRSPLAKNPELSLYSEIDILEKFDWSPYTCPIVFAHSASYGYSAREIRDYIIPHLLKILEKHTNILIDISGVDIRGMIYLLEEIPSDRILFGSDALYEPQWQRMVKLLFALEKSSVDTEESFSKIMSHNPENYIFYNRRFDSLI
jgi:hypothetical protein